MKAINKNSLFICQAAENSLKVCVCSAATKEFLGLEAETIPLGVDNEKAAQSFITLLKKMEYCGNPVIIALSRSLVTCRILKIPSSLPEEIERIASLQAPHYLPYPAEELIIGYQVLQIDQEGYADINLIIAHKDIIERQVKVFKDLKAVKIDVILNSYGLSNLYNHVNPQSTSPVMFVDIDSQQVELAVIFQKKVFFSRSFKFVNNTQDGALLLSEVNRTQEAYLKGAQKEKPVKIVVSCAASDLPRISEILNKQSALPVEPLAYKHKIKFASNQLSGILDSGNSFAGLIGLGLDMSADSLSLLPKEAKEEKKRAVEKKARWKIFSFVFAIVLIWGLAAAKSLDNKAWELARLKKQLQKIADEAKPLEEIEKRFKILGGQNNNKLNSLDILHELYSVMPEKIALINFTYEEGVQVALRGQAVELSSVFTFAEQLGRSEVFKKFNVKVNYATKKKSRGLSDVVDFEIICTKK